MTNQYIRCGLLYESANKYSRFLSGWCRTCLEARTNRTTGNSNQFRTKSNGTSSQKETRFPYSERYHYNRDRRTQSNPGGKW